MIALRTRSVGVALGFVALAALVAACGKKEGGSCKGSESLCADKKSALVCRGDKLTRVPCEGPAGCAKTTTQASCDTSTANPGDPCMNEGDDEYACTPDAKRALVCQNGKFEPSLECRGKAGCSVRGHSLSCDGSIAMKGDPCKVQGGIACSEDQKEMLLCRDGKLSSYRYCRGQLGCTLKGDTPSCDDTYSLIGDPCGVSGQVVCAVDHSAELVCQGGVFIQSRRCKKGCTVSNRPDRGLECD